MMNAHRITRTLGMAAGSLLAVGLGIGAAVASTPGIASADDMQISIDGMDLFPTAGNTAYATSGPGDIAIAIGFNSDATATGGFGDFATAEGSYADAFSGYGSLDFASATGNNSSASATYGDFDDAVANGTTTVATAGGYDSNVLGNSDSASAWGAASEAIAGHVGTGFDTTGSGDVANVFDPFGTVGSDAFAGNGDFDLATVFGDVLNAMAVGDNFLIDILP